MSQKIFQVDAFANAPFQGNPAAVCVGERPFEERWMQCVAAEMNLSETAFLYPENTGYRLRWFTPLTEVALCGHATLASAHVLWETGVLSEGATARFHTLSGLLTATKRNGWIELDFPVKQAESVEPPPGLLAALGIAAKFVGRNQFDYLVETTSTAELRAMKPDFGGLATLPVRGVIVTAASDDPRYDFVSRFFAPAAGVNEDPVTGSAHCCLGPYWEAKLGRFELTAFQASQRGGEIRLKVRGSRIILAGKAVTVLHGELTNV